MNIIEKIHSSPVYGFIVETGASAAISNALLSYPGASKTIESSYIPYSRDYVDYLVGYEVPKNIRSVSSEYTKILSTIPLKSERGIFLKKKLGTNFFVLSSSFQISNSPTISSHGWISILIGESDINTYHFTLKPMLVGEDPISYRMGIIETISNIGPMVIYKNMIEDIDIPYMDICESIDSRRNVLRSLIQTPIDMAVVFNPDGSSNRLESVVRNIPDLIVFKGSFNPPHKAHLNMMRIVEEKIATKGYFSISMNTFGKGYVGVDDMIHRINMINSLGYSVIVNKDPLFEDFIKLFNNRLDEGTNLHFVMGEDTAIRYIEYSSNYREFIPTRIKEDEIVNHECVYHVFRRSSDELSLPNDFIVYEFNESTSSTYVRESLNFDYLDSSIINYIKQNNLYKK